LPRSARQEAALTRQRCAAAAISMVRAVGRSKTARYCEVSRI
jgi:hypothetical protein